MRRVAGLLGSLLFWLLWPVWFVYLRFSNNRSRVLVVCNGEILLIKPWLGRKKYSLPGGGIKKGETARDAAVRELTEETGIIVTPRGLKRIGLYGFSEAGLKYKASIYSVELNTKPVINPDKIEIWEYCWVEISKVDILKLSKNTRHAISRYRPQQQRRLL